MVSVCLGSRPPTSHPDHSPRDETKHHPWTTLSRVCLLSRCVKRFPSVLFLFTRYFGACTPFSLYTTVYTLKFISSIARKEKSPFEQRVWNARQNHTLNEKKRWGIAYLGPKPKRKKKKKKKGSWGIVGTLSGREKNITIRRGGKPSLRTHCIGRRNLCHQQCTSLASKPSAPNKH